MSRKQSSESRKARRVGPGTLHVTLEQSPTASTPVADSKFSFESLRDLIALVSAGAGIFVALLYLAGRNYASGYFGAMNIPAYQVSFSIWEYGEVAWQPMFVYSTGTMMVAGLFWGVIYTFGDWLSPFFIHTFEWFRNWLKKALKIKPSTRNLPEIGRQAKGMFVFAQFMFAIFLVTMVAIFTLQFVRNYGASGGQTQVLENAARVELVSANPMTLDNPTPVTAQAGGQEDKYYTYSGFRLLTFNGGKYYLFKEIDPLTCKPLKVYVIDADQYKQVNLLAAESLSSRCQKIAKTNTAPAPTAIATATP